MDFVRIAGLPGKVYVPDPDSGGMKKHPCPDCHCCQGCSKQRCHACRDREEGRKSECPEPEA